MVLTVEVEGKRILLAQKRVLWGYTFLSVTPDMFNDLTVSMGLIWGKVHIDTIKENIVSRQAELVPVAGYVPEEETEEGETDVEATESEKVETEPKETEKKGGCGSSVALSALAVVAVVGTAVVLKKKED